MKEYEFNSVLIIGVGLIGGSLALALKKKNIAKTIIGLGRNKERLIEAQRLSIIDEYTLSPKEVEKTDLVILATPLGIFEKITKEISPFLRPGCILMDVGSVKQWVVKTLEKIIPSGVYFIGTHPIAGSDKTGFEHAKGTLFKGAKVIITPTDKTHKEALDKITKMWENLGAIVEYMSPEKHDSLYALMSHLPHLISFCLVNTVDKVDKNSIKYAGSGFKDTTRIAKSSPEIWKDIFLLNRDNIINVLHVFLDSISEIKDYLKNNLAEDKIEEFILRAKKLREELD